MDNNKKNTVLLTALAFFACGIANAQIRMGAGMYTGLPMGTEATDQEFGFGIGAGFSAEYMFNVSIGVALNIANVSFSSEVMVTDPVSGISTPSRSTLKVVPINISWNYYFMPGKDFNAYASLSYGMNMNTLSTVTEGFPESPDLEGYSLDFCPRIGFNYMLSEHFGLDFSAGYNFNSFLPRNAIDPEEGDFSYLPINIGVVYALFE
ncbi:MAG: hypothetical protein EBT52_07115 [Flavobacteriia bacterium]|nr:hypothetical protein [Flavobacteriia bacterium]